MTGTRCSRQRRIDEIMREPGPGSGFELAEFTGPPGRVR
jgi:hypothetical protein